MPSFTHRLRSTNGNLFVQMTTGSLKEENNTFYVFAIIGKKTEDGKIQFFEDSQVQFATGMPGQRIEDIMISKEVIFRNRYSAMEFSVSDKKIITQPYKK